MAGAAPAQDRLVARGSLVLAADHGGEGGLHEALRKAGGFQRRPFVVGEQRRALDAIVGRVAPGLGYAVLPARVVDLFGDRHALHTDELEGPHLGLVETAFVCLARPPEAPP